MRNAYNSGMLVQIHQLKIYWDRQKERYEICHPDDADLEKLEFRMNFWDYADSGETINEIERDSRYWEWKKHYFA